MAQQSSMWGFLGKTPPASSGKKRKLSDEEKKEQSKQYEKTKRQRTYQSSWQSEFAWLEHKNDKMFCSWCCKHGQSGIKKI